MQEVSTPPMCEVVIFTALGLEFKAVSEHLQDMQEVTHQGTVYGYGNFIGQHRTWHVAVVEIGMGGPTAATETERAINYFRPQITLFVGVGGGLKDVKLGDVVVASKVYAYESGKVERQFQPRPEVWRASHALEQRARAEARNDQWLTFLVGSCPASVPQVHIGALAAGEKVLASTQSDLFRLLKEIYGDSLAVEMEGHGFLTAVHANHSVHALVIRGISDMIDGKSASDTTGSQTVAARHAAAFAFQVLAKFTLPTSNSTSSLPAAPVVWNVPYSRNPHFTGRDDLLDRLHQQLTLLEQNDLAKTRRTVLTQPQAIKGLGGIGKTQIAVEYAYHSREQGCYTHTLWINAASEETIIASFMKIEELLPTFSAKNGMNQRKPVEAVKSWLEKCEQRWLLIFDNADDISLVRNFLPQNEKGSILLTTRAQAVGSLDASSIEVGNMGLREGTELLLRRAQHQQASDEEQDEATNVAIALDYFPLALDQAGAYIEETKCGFVGYLKVYQDHRKELLARRGKLATDYLESVATTWALSFQKVNQANPAAAELLRLCAFLAPDKIPEELIRDGAVYWSPLLQYAATDLFVFNQMIEELLKFSLIERLVETQMLSIHRLVQVVQMDSMELDVQRSWAERVVRALNEVFPNDYLAIHDRQHLRYLDQVEVCNILIGQYKLIFTEGADLLTRTGLYLDLHTLYAVAEPLFLRALEIREQVLEAEHPDIANSLRNLAEVYRAQRKYRKAEPLFLRALEIQERVLEAGHLDMADTLFYLAQLYWNKENFAEAEPLLLRELHIREQAWGPEDSRMATRLNGMALFYCQQGKYAEAEPFSQRYASIREQEIREGRIRVIQEGHLDQEVWQSAVLRTRNEVE